MTTRRAAAALLLLSVAACCWAADPQVPQGRPSYASVVAGRKDPPPTAGPAVGPGAGPDFGPPLGYPGPPSPGARRPGAARPLSAVKSEAEVADAVTEFSLDIVKDVLRGAQGNAAVSALGVTHLLSLLQQAADPLSDTAAQLERGLRLDQASSLKGVPRLLQNAVTKKNSKTVLESGNNMFVNAEFRLKEPFLAVARDGYDTNVTSLDFKQQDAAVGAINKWVSESTHGRIPSLVSKGALSPRTSAVLTSAMYFRGVWRHMFDAGKTVQKLFSVDPRRNATVFMMQQAGDFRTGELPDLDAQWLELPFDGDHFSMLLVLPDKRHGLDEVLQGMSARHVRSVLEYAGPLKRTVLLMPRFQIATEASLARTLKQLGMRALFSRDAKLRRASDSALSVSDVVHKAEMKVDEQGASASAASAVLVNTLSLVSFSEDMRFFADHPFLAIIVDRTSKVPLFVSRVANPIEDF